MRNLRLLRSCTSTAAAGLLLCGAPASAQDAAKAPESSNDASTDKRIDELTREVADLKGLVLRLQEQLRQVIGAPLAKETVPPPAAAAPATAPPAATAPAS